MKLMLSFGLPVRRAAASLLVCVTLVSLMVDDPRTMLYQPKFQPRNSRAGTATPRNAKVVRMVLLPLFFFPLTAEHPQKVCGL